MYEYYLPESPQPELLRSPLENVVLKAKMLEMGPPHQILALAMDTPKLTNVANTILVLKELGAMLHTVNGKASIHDGDITFMGIIMASLPVDVRVARLIVLGYIFSVLEESVIMGEKENNFENCIFRNLMLFVIVFSGSGWSECEKHFHPVNSR